MSSTHPPPGPGDNANGDSAPSGSSEAQRLAPYGIERLLAPNPGPFTLSGTNTWLVAREPTWLIDPGPLEDAHLERMFAAIDERGGLGGVALTHDHCDHSQAVDAVLSDYSAPLAGGRGRVDVRLDNEVRFGPFVAVATPGHAADHFALVAHGACFTGDAVLGEGSVFIFPDPGALAGYLQGLERLRRRRLELLCPGHGPLVLDADAKLTEYIEHRLDRERRLVAALDGGKRTVNELLDDVWDDAPEMLRPAAAVTLAAHLDKLEEDGRLPEGVERPAMPRLSEP